VRPGTGATSLSPTRRAMCSRGTGNPSRDERWSTRGALRRHELPPERGWGRWQHSRGLRRAPRPRGPEVRRDRRLPARATGSGRRRILAKRPSLHDRPLSEVCETRCAPGRCAPGRCAPGCCVRGSRVGRKSHSYHISHFRPSSTSKSTDIVGFSWVKPASG
jgi:hypothetical protein